MMHCIIHQKKIYEKYDIENQNCYVSNHVLDEIVTIIGQNEGSKLAHQTYLMIKDNLTILNEYEIPNFNFKVMKSYLEKNNNDKQIGFTDTSIIEVIKYYNMTKLVTFDKELAKKSPIDIINKKKHIIK